MNNIYHITQEGNTQVLSVSNLFNELDNRKIINDVSQRIERGAIHFLIDLSTVPYLNSVGLNCLLSIQHKSMKAGGEFTLKGVSPQVMRLLEITKLKSFFRLTAVTVAEG